MRYLTGWLTALLLLSPGLATESKAAREKPPLPWPSNRDVRRHEPGCWKPRGDSFSPAEAWQAAGKPFADSLAASGLRLERRDLRIDGFVTMRVPAPLSMARRAASRRCELAAVRYVQPVMGDENEATTTALLVLTSGHKLLWKKELSQTTTWMPAEHHRLARVITRFDPRPFVLLFSDTGGSTRDFVYDLYRAERADLEKVWADDLADGHTGSTRQGYAWSNFDFSKLTTGSANTFTVYTTSGFRRRMAPGNEERLEPTCTKRTYRWNKDQGTFVKSSESSAKRS